MDLTDIFKAPANADGVYLNNAASTKPLPVLLDGYQELWKWAYLNPSTKGQASSVLKKAILGQQRAFLKSIRIDNAEVVWTSSGTEANNLAIFGSIPDTGSWVGSEVVTTVAEHPSVSEVVNELESMGARVTRIPIDAAGKIDKEALAGALTPLTRLVTLGLVHGETGIIQELPAIRHIMNAHAPLARLHVDAVQALTKTDLFWNRSAVDLMSFSGHKFHAFGGVGALLVRNGVSLKPQMFGGGQQNGIRSGSLDGAGILSFLIAANFLLENAATFHGRVTYLSRLLRRGISELKDKKGQVISPHFVSTEDASPFILNVAFPDYEGAVLMRILDSMGITISTGSACSAGSSVPSKVLTMMGLERRMAFAAIRISLGYYTSEDDIKAFLNGLQEALLSY